MDITPRQKELLETEGIAVATLDDDGSPNLIAVGYARVVAPGTIVITDNFMKRTPENIKRDPRITLAVWTKDWEEGWKFTGTATYETSGTWAEYVRGMKVNAGYPAKGAVVVTVRGIYKLG